MASGFHDPNFDHLCHCEGVKHSMCFSSEILHHYNTTLDAGGEDVKGSGGNTDSIGLRPSRPNSGESVNGKSLMPVFDRYGNRLVFHNAAVDENLPDRGKFHGHGYETDQALALMLLPNRMRRPSAIFDRKL